MRTSTPFSNDPNDLPQVAAASLSTSHQIPLFDMRWPGGDPKIAGRQSLSTFFSGVSALVGAGSIVGPQSLSAEAVTAAADPGAAISATASFVTVTSANANNIAILPAPVVGKILIVHVGATGYELRSSDPATISINGGSGAGAESAIAANSTCILICVSATAWKRRGWGS